MTLPLSPERALPNRRGHVKAQDGRGKGGESCRNDRGGR